ncbi:sensor histidine kinase [Thioalkalivibrio sp. ALJ9]|uniref:sensor histidine kinase n=1 Tax=Thioalkalivibrio sp. ALJ9 TaxID=1158758 RepID=UPI00035D922B|nr:ATP-binding protein [Thioalkalivibrio sp. ALJ9]
MESIPFDYLWIVGAAVILVALGAIHTFRLNVRLRRTAQELQREVNERHRTENRLAEHEARLRQIIDTEPECVKLQNLEGRLLEMNPAGLALLDANKPQQIIGTSVYQMVAPEFREAYRDLTRRVFDGESGVLEFQIVSLKGRRRWMETHAAPLLDADGAIVALLGITRDITPRKLAEDGVRLHYRELARAARINTMGEMASGLAHELNQPLAAIANYANGCLRHLNSNACTPDELTSPLESISSQANRAAEIIQGLRHFVNKDPPKKSLEDLNRILHSVILIARPEINLHHVQLHLDLEPELPCIEVQPIQLEQVLLNLIRNAVEAMDETPPSLRHLVIRTSSESHKVFLDVQDTGPGMPSHVLLRVFEPFFTTKETGMGMGLPISRSIIEGHGGELNVQSDTKDVGLSIQITLPTVTHPMHQHLQALKADSPTPPNENK